MTTYLETVIRRNAGAFASSCAGLVANPTAADDGWPRYLRLIAPGESPARAAEMARMSGCALFAGRGYLRAVLRVCPSPLTGAYHDGRALADLHEAAEFAEAVRPAWHEPQIGDVVHLGAAGAVEHVYVVASTAPSPYRGVDVDSVDGGQRRGAYEAIEARQRVLVPAGADGALEDQLVDGPTRPVLAIYDLAALVQRYGASAAMLTGG